MLFRIKGYKGHFYSLFFTQARPLTLTLTLTLNKAFEEQQEVVYDELDVDGSDVEEAVRFYISKGSKELKNISESIRLVFRKFGAQVAEDDEEEQVKEEAKKEVLFSSYFLLVV
jgi:hypothetical protein